jgi:methylenetetrahydrofolate dehydrogenase (NADP+)/methenyltetrahydrofolate cyclohydrolase
MSAQIIDGKLMASQIKVEIKEEVEKLKAKKIIPGLATLLVGDNPASQVYVRNKHRACEDVGMVSFHHALAQDATTLTVLKKVRELNSDPNVHGILVQLPLPSQIDAHLVLETVSPRKDVDGFHPYNLGRLLAVKHMAELDHSQHQIPIPCTPYGVMVLLEKIGVQVAGKNAVVLGRSMIVGKPLAALLLAHNATVTVAHSQTQNLIEYCKRADILVAAMGQPERVDSPMVKPGAIVIDVGINRKKTGQLCGDVHFDSVKEKASWITPVPGGVGPMTIVMLLKNTIRLAQNLVHDQ